MKLRRVRLDGFGALRGEFAFDTGRVTLVVDDNERGKSTLLAAIAAGLYGLEDDRRSHRNVTPRDRWRPWDGGTYRVELELESNGRVLTVKRDFERDTVEVWDDHGAEVTTEFREGKDRFPVGAKLLGLDVEEFARCAMIAQGELARVIPNDAKERGGSGLRARLENAADSKAGDTSATEAVKLLEGALRRYHCAELDSTLQVDTAMARLELKRAQLDVDLKTLEHDLEQARGPLDELAGLDDDERAARAELQALESERQAALAGDVRRQVGEDERHREEVRKLEEEAAALAAAAHLAPNAEASFGETVGRYQEAKHNLDAIEQRRRDETAREQDAINLELSGLQAVSTLSLADADRCVTVAGDIRRLEAEDGRVRDEVFSLRDGLASRGHEPERMQWLQERFGAMPPERLMVLRRQSELQLAHQTQVADLERERTHASELVRGIDEQRNRWRLPGWSLMALGLAGLVAGTAVMALRGLPVMWTWLFAGGGLLVVLGGVILASGGRARGSERDDALRRLAEAQRQLAALKQARAETEVNLQVLARQMGYRDLVDLLREWNEYARLADESGPVMRAQQQLAEIERRRRAAHDEATVLAGRAALAEVTPEGLEETAARIRRMHQLQQAAKDLDRRSSRLDDERRVIQAQVDGLLERAMKILQSAGLAYDPDRSWEDHARELAARGQARVRWALVTEELLPKARQRLLDPRALESLRAQLAGVETPATGRPDAGAPRPPIAIEQETRRLREKLDALARRRADLRVAVEETDRRYRAEHPEKLLQRERVEAALMRARRFKHSVELARDTVQKVAADTHRRWADFLNERVGGLLSAMSHGAQQLRFGDDLDFSVKVGNGQQLARGKADVQLSAGARDQLYLAVRLAVSEFLSRGGEAVPFLLDDVFVTSDDERTRAGMKLLIEQFAKDHQVLMLTCHRKRFEALAAMDPELYRERIQWVDAAAFSRTGG